MHRHGIAPHDYVWRTRRLTRSARCEVGCRITGHGKSNIGCAQQAELGHPTCFRFEVEAVFDIAQCCGCDVLADLAARALAGSVAAMTTALVRRR